MLTKDIQKIIDEALIQIYKDLDQGYDKVRNDFYALLSDIYTYVLKYLRNKYPNVSTKKIDIRRLLYDNLSDQRLKQAADNFLDTKDKREYFYILSRICDTECYTLMNKLMYEKMKDIADYAIVHGGDSCDHCATGVYNIKELRLPPYHPDCKCWVEYVIGDDVEIEELEDEIDDELM